MNNNNSNSKGPLAYIINISARNPYMTILFVFMLGMWGWYSLKNSPVDAIPDLSDVQVIIFTEWPGQSPDLIEDQITYPVSSALLAAPKVQFVRGQSFFGLSFVYVIFEEGTDMYWARSRVLEYMNEISSGLPPGITPTLGPDATGVGWVFQYALVDKTGQMDLQQLRSLQDWNIRYALESVKGVAEVASIGGFVKEYQIQIDPDKLRSFEIPLKTVIKAVRESNEDAGGKVIEIAGHEHMIRGRGYIKKISDLEQIPLIVSGNGVPVTVGDVAEVSIGPQMRRGLAEWNGEGEVVGGIVIMRYGENALRVIDAVKKRLDEVEAGLPDGVEIKIAYDRSGLINDSIKTLTRTLIEEMIVVSIIIFLFLMHARSALVALIALPTAVIISFIPMFYQGLTANIMSLGGIAVAIGAMVDAAVIIIENIHKQLEAWEKKGKPGNRIEVIISAMQEVGPSIFFSLLIIMVSFLPIFTLEATEGRLFKPLAYTKTFSMGFAAMLAVTLTPALAVLFIRGKIKPEEANPLNRILVKAYVPVVKAAIKFRWLVVGLSLAAILATIPVYLKLSSEFMPPLNEGAILYMPTSPPGMSITEASNILQSMNRQLKEFPEVESVFGKMGRARTATDPAPISMVETTVMLKPRDQWRPGVKWSDLIAEMEQKLKYPGMPNIWWMPIQTRTEMLATGVRSPLGIQVFGDDLASIEKTAVEIEAAIENIPGTRSAFAERSTGGFFVDFEIRRDKASRYGLSVKDISNYIQTALGGMTIEQTIEGRERYGIQVRFAREWRDHPEALERAAIQTPGGQVIPISSVADIKFRNGPPMIRSEGGKLVGFVFVDPGDRPIAEYVKEAKYAVAEKVDLPAGTRLGWAGQFQYLERARERMTLILPITLLIVIFLLYLHTKSVVQTAILLSTVPMALIGSVWILYLMDYNLSVAVWVGAIALMGIAVETGVVMLLYLNLAYAKAQDENRMKSYSHLREAIVEGAARRIRPKLMAVLTTFIGLLPILWSSGTGADVMKRIAAPMVGGLTTSFLLELILYPAIFALWKGRSLKDE